MTGAQAGPLLAHCKAGTADGVQHSTGAQDNILSVQELKVKSVQLQVLSHQSAGQAWLLLF